MKRNKRELNNFWIFELLGILLIITLTILVVVAIFDDNKSKQNVIENINLAKNKISTKIENVVNDNTYIQNIKQINSKITKINTKIYSMDQKINNFIDQLNKIKQNYIVLDLIPNYIYENCKNISSKPLLQNKFYLFTLDYYVKKYSLKWNVPYELIYAIIHVESSYDPFLVSHKNCIGLMQINYEVWKKSLRIRNQMELFNIDKNIAYGTRIFKHYIEKNHGDLKQAIKDYFGKSKYAEKYLNKIWEKYQIYNRINLKL